MIEIIPSILVKTEKELLEKVLVTESLTGRAHLDIADGLFVSNVTIEGPREIDRLKTSLKFTVHLMVSRPENHLGRWLALAETEKVDQFIFHVEGSPQPLVAINLLKDQNCLAGLALNPSTPLSTIKSLIDEIDFVHFLTVEPGFYGGKFLPEVVSKIVDFHYFYPDKIISVDGGVNPDNASELIKAGASRLVVGSYLWQNENLGRAWQEINESAANH